MTRLVGVTALAIATTSISMSAANTTIATFTDFSGSQPFSANTLDASLSSGTLGGTGLAAVATGGDPGSYVSDSTGASWVITLVTADALTPASLTFNYQRTAYFGNGLNISWSYSLNGDTATSLGNTSTIGSSWGSDSLNLSSIGNVAADTTITLDATFTTTGINLDNLDVSASSITNSPSVPDTTNTMALAAGALGLMAGLRARLRK